MTVSVGGGGCFGTLSAEDERRESLGSDESFPQIRATLEPLGWSRHSRIRRFDLGVGYLLEGGRETFLNHGPSLGGSYYVWQRMIQERWVARLGVDATADLLWSRDAGTGGGGTVGLRFDLLGFNDGPFHSRRSAGWALGEGGLGIYVHGGGRVFSDMRYGMVSAGVRITLPLAAGVVTVL
jgi:hypothetical protein